MNLNPESTYKVWNCSLLVPPIDGSNIKAYRRELPNCFAHTELDYSRYFSIGWRVSEIKYSWRKDHWEQVISQKLADFKQILQFTIVHKVCAEMGPKIILLSLISIITSNYLAHWDSQCNEARREGAK